MSGRLVVKRYARALVETAEHAGTITEIEEDMDIIDKILSEAPPIRSFCLKPNSSRLVETDFVKTAFIPYVGEFTGRMLLTSVENGRIAAIPFITRAVKDILEEKRDSTTVLVESARKLDSEILEKLKIKMINRTGKQINFQIKIVPEILGGFRIIWQNKIIDMSALGRLKKVCQLLS